ncbi:MAG: Ig-like domain-containing protein [Chitinophagaceae bacterium]
MKWWSSLILLLFISCGKDAATANDNELPVVTINTPTNNQVFIAGQPITISGSITDNNYIAEVHIHVSNTNTGALLMDVHLYPAGSTTTFNQSITAVSGVNYKIQVIAKDKAVNEGRATVEVASL